MKTYWEKRGIMPCILSNFGIRWRYVFS